jgi:hypothetical protein
MESLDRKGSSILSKTISKTPMKTQCLNSNKCKCKSKTYKSMILERLKINNGVKGNSLMK